MQEIRPQYQGGTQYRIAIAVASWNELATQSLLKGAVEELQKLGVPTENITIIHCSGSFELPFVIARCIETQRYDAVIALGVLIRGETPHFDLIASAVTSAIQQLNLQGPIPCIFGVLTTDTVEQALERSGLKAGNKGREYARAAVEMAAIAHQIRQFSAA